MRTVRRRNTRNILLGTALLTLAGFSTTATAGNLAAEKLVKEGHWKRARAIVERQYRANPDDPELSYLLSEIRDAFGNLESARDFAEKAVALDGSDSRYHLQLAIVDGKTAESASLFARARWANKFKVEAERAAELDPTNLDACFSLLEFYLRAPRLMGGGKEKAEAMAEQIARIDPASGTLAQARLARSQKNLAGEENYYLKALALDPQNYDAMINLGSFYAREPHPKVDLAGKYGRRAVALDPARVDGYSLLASVSASAARWGDLDAILDRAAKEVPDDLTPCYRAGQTILERTAPGGPDLGRAESCFRRYLSAEPEGNAPSLAEAHWRLGLVLEKAGHRPQAVSELKEALQLRPDFEEAKRDLRRTE